MDSIDFAKNVYEKITAAAIDNQTIIFFIFFEILIIPIAHEIIPETHRRGHENWATGGFTFGLLIMLSLDILLG